MIFSNFFSKRPNQDKSLNFHWNLTLWALEQHPFYKPQPIYQSLLQSHQVFHPKLLQDDYFLIYKLTLSHNSDNFLDKQYNFHHPNNNLEHTSCTHLYSHYNLCNALNLYKLKFHFRFFRYFLSIYHDNCLKKLNLRERKYHLDNSHKFHCLNMYLLHMLNSLHWLYRCKLYNYSRLQNKLTNFSWIFPSKRGIFTKAITGAFRAFIRIWSGCRAASTRTTAEIIICQTGITFWSVRCGTFWTTILACCTGSFDLGEIYSKLFLYFIARSWTA